MDDVTGHGLERDRPAEVGGSSPGGLGRGRDHLSGHAHAVGLEQAFDLALGQGPVCIPGEDNRRARAALERLPRRQLVELMGEQTRKLFTG